MRTSLLLCLTGAVAVLAGCSTPTAPDHIDAWLSFKFGQGCGSAQACTVLRDDSEADAYYQAIGAEDSTGQPTYNLDQWEQLYGIRFATPVRAAYGNQLDLQFGRDMNCIQPPTTARVVCYVTNYGPAPFDGKVTFDENPNWPNLDQGVSDAELQNNPFATVAMVFDPNGIGTNQDKVAFWVFDGAGNLVKEAALDGEGGKTNPRMCMACHGGSYDATKHSATGANFLPFDVQSFHYDQNSPTFSIDAQQEAFRQLNELVLAASPTQAIQDLINGLYNNQVHTQGATIPDDTFIPSNDWSSTDESKNIYKGVFRKYCRMCHAASTAVPFATFANFTALAGSIQSIACNSKGSHDMPHTEVAFGGLKGSSNRFGGGQGLWMDGVAQSDLQAFFKNHGLQPPTCD